MAKFVLVTQQEFSEIWNRLPEKERVRVGSELAFSPVYQWGFQALRFCSPTPYDEWIVVPYMEVGTAKEAIEAASNAI